MVRAIFWRYLRAAPVTGAAALLCACLAVLLPTVLRAAVSGIVTGCEFTPYLPFVLVSALTLRASLASAVALTSAAVMGGMFGGFRAYELPCFASASAIFLGASAVIIAIAIVGRHVLFALLKPDRDGGGLVFSLEKGEVWASWYGNDVPVCLGTQRKVAELMEDFLAQGQAKRVTRE